MYRLPQPPVHQRPDPGVPGGRHKGVEEPVRDSPVYVDPLDGHAQLPGVGERSGGRLAGGPYRVHVRVHHQRIAPTVLQQDLRAGTGARRRDTPAGRGRAHVRDDVEPLLDEPGTDRTVAGQVLKDAVRQEAGDQFGEQRTGTRGPLARLGDHGVPGDERGSDQPARHGHRVVPRREYGHHAPRLVHHQVDRLGRAGQRAAAMDRPELRVLPQCRDAGVHAGPRLRERAPHLLRGQPGQLVGARGHLVSRAGDGGRPVRGWRRRPVG
jgi:hypothetical protein